MMMSCRIFGFGASGGLAVAPTIVLDPAADEEIVLAEFADPQAAFAAACEDAAADLSGASSRAAESGRAEAASVLSAQALMAADPMLAGQVTEALDAGVRLREAIESAAAAMQDALASIGDPYLAERATDVGEVAKLLLRKLSATATTDPTVDACVTAIESSDGSSPPTAKAEARSPHVLVASALTAADTASLEADLVAGLVTEQGGPTGHVAVIARSLGIPAVVGAAGVTEAAESGDIVALDGDSGEVVIRPSPDILAQFSQRADARQRFERAAAALVGRQVAFDGRHVAIAANVGGPQDVARAVDEAAEGIGLYRTEFLFADRPAAPSEEDQYEHYAEAANSFLFPVVVRLADIGGDKPVPWLDMEHEDNPFLGLRGPRLYAVQTELLATQLRALLRAAVHGDVWIMVPMVATVADFTEVRSALEAERAALAARSVRIGDPALGMMIEVPSAAIIADRLAAHTDFMSIGTNDLAQYTLAADRTDARLARYADAAHPAILGLCMRAARAATAAGISISVCGEAAADPVLAAAFASMGVSRLSVAPPMINATKAAVAGRSAAAVTEALELAMGAEDAEEARAALSGVVSGTSGDGTSGERR